MMPIETARLRLRDWQDEDLPLFARLNADRRVMRFFPAPLTAGESDAFAARIRAELTERGYGLYALERKADGAFLGYTGLHRFDFDVPFAPGVEIGWRLAAEAWGRGYASEAARAVLDDARARLAPLTVWSFTAVCNTPSERVMRRIGMRPAGHFDHPALPEGHRLREHVLYHIDF